MKLLFDHNLSPRLVIQLAALYPDSLHVYQLSLDQSDDKIVRDYARNHDLIVVTKDVDFSDLCFWLGFPPKVIWVRAGNCPTRHIETLLRKHHQALLAFENDLVIGVFTLI